MSLKIHFVDSHLKQREELPLYNFLFNKIDCYGKVVDFSNMYEAITFLKQLLARGLNHKKQKQPLIFESDEILNHIFGKINYFGKRKRCFFFVDQCYVTLF